MSDTQATLASYMVYLERRGWLVRVGDVPWMLADRRLTPAVPPHRMGPVDRTEVRRALRQSGAIAALWNDAWDTSPGPWWWVCCDDRQYDLERIRSGSRRKCVKRGLRQCSSRMIGVDELGEIGYDVYAAAFDRYAPGAKPLSREAYVADVRRNAEYGGRETWGAFVGGRLAAYATCIVVDDVVYVSASKSNPAMFKCNPNEALRFEMTRHYLRDRRMTYVISGMRVLQHESNIQEFLESMGYRKIYCPLRLEMRAGVSAALRLGVVRWARMAGMGRWYPGLLKRIEALDMAYSIARICASEFP
jgi:hypothetical protein